LNKKLANIDNEKLSEEKEILLQTNPLIILGYIKTCFEIIMNMQKAEKESFKECSVNENGYEQIIQNLEEEIRNHIRIEQQLKIHVEMLQGKIEEAEKNDQNNETNIKTVNLVSIRRNSGFLKIVSMIKIPK